MQLKIVICHYIAKQDLLGQKVLSYVIIDVMLTAKWGERTDVGAETGDKIEKLHGMESDTKG